MATADIFKKLARCQDLTLWTTQIAGLATSKKRNENSRFTRG
jgi:hypothetical protein